MTNHTTNLTANLKTISGQSRLAWLIAAIPFLCAALVWLSPLSFVPVPWPDDSAFYFVAHELFKIPPRFVMLPQAPFEPTYQIYNFNTMPLFPILIGIGRFIGIDGSHLLKLWPLTFWAATGSILSLTLYRKGLPALGAIAVALAFGLDPELRWASVLVRPESLIGLLGAAALLGLTFGFPRRWEARGRYWDPTAALLALAAYTHFNAVHIVFPVTAAILITTPERPWRRVFRIGALTALYLVPYFLTILARPALYIQQMGTQWKRLAVGNGWLNSPKSALESLFQTMGSPTPFTPVVNIASIVLWVLIALAIVMLIPATVELIRKERGKTLQTPSPVPYAIWLLSACWLWHTKPEVWFVYYIHAAAITFAGALALRFKNSGPALRFAPPVALALLIGIFSYANGDQLKTLSQGESWRWSSYHALIDCIDRRLIRLEAELGHPKPFRVWDPTFPDVTIELVRRHPDWQFTRTNDFWERNHLAIRHGHEVEAVVVPETVNFAERRIDSPMLEHPEIQSVWMTWDGYFLKELWKDATWKPERHLCQIGRWQAFIFMKPAMNSAPSTAPATRSVPTSGVPSRSTESRPRSPAADPTQSAPKG